MMQRRSWIKGAVGAGASLVGAGLGMHALTSHSAQPTGYKALVVVHLNGGLDGNDVLVPLDGAFSDYEKSRPSIALRRDTLVPFGSPHLNHRLGLNGAMARLMPMFEQRRLAFLVNTGPLIEPTTVADVLNGRAKLPPFLYSHPEQTHYVQGWMGDEDPSGWAGRGIEVLAGRHSLRSPLLSVDQSGQTLVLGRRSRIVNVSSHDSRWIGRADLTNTQDPWTQLTASLTRMQSPVTVENEFARSFKAAFEDAQELAIASEKFPEPKGDFGDHHVGRLLRQVARFMPYYKSAGATRQVYSINWGNFDSHVGQRYRNDDMDQALDPQLAQLSEAMLAFDQSVRSSGLDQEVVLLVISEFGRTLDPAAGLGSDHAWGNHWIAQGGPVRGGELYGRKFPRLVLGGEDDIHGERGYWLPQFASDQVAADALLWLGLPARELTSVMPNLANFNEKNVGYLHV